MKLSVTSTPLNLRGNSKVTTDSNLCQSKGEKKTKKQTKYQSKHKDIKTVSKCEFVQRENYSKNMILSSFKGVSLTTHLTNKQTNKQAERQIKNPGVLYCADYISFLRSF